MESVFENVYLVSKIQHYLSFEELLISRLVATNWNYSAINYLTKCTVRINSGEKFNELMLVLKSSNQPLPLKYSKYKIEDILIEDIGAIEQILNNIGRYLAKLKLGFAATSNNNHIFIGKEIFQKINEGLQVLHIESPSKQIWVDVSQMKFPGLEKLKLRNCFISSHLNVNAKMSLKTIQIRDCYMDPYFLIGWLTGCVNLQRLELGDEKFSPPKKKHRITLPNLKQFHLTAKLVSTDYCCGRCLVEDITEEYLESLLFFNKVDNQNWRIENILTLKTNVELVVGGTILKIDHNKGEILGVHHVVTSILKNLHDFQLNGLELEGILPNINGLPSSLKRFSLNCHVGVSFSADGLLRRCNQLEELTLSEAKSILCLDDIPPTLKRLSLIGMEYTYSPNVTVTLDYLCLNYVAGSPVQGEVHRRFSEIFKVKFLYLPMLCVCNDLVQDILTMEYVEYIVLCNYCDKNYCEALNFTLENSSVSIHDDEFYLTRKNGVWYADTFQRNPIPNYEKESTGIYRGYRLKM